MIDNGAVVETEAEAVAYLTKDGPHLLTPCSRYGRNSAQCAPIAWQVAEIVARECGEVVTTADLDYAMGLVVNDADDIQYLLDEYGTEDK